MPAGNVRGGEPQMRARGVNWDDEADRYNAFVFCELQDTQRYLDLIGIDPDDTVLDVCCGPGRISLLAAQRAKQVTGIDLSAKMLQHARENAAERGISNVEFVQLDWNCVLPGQNVKKHDIVIASRNQAMGEIEKLSALARKTVMIQIFADAPSIPALLGVLFNGCEKPDADKMMQPGAGRPGGPGAFGSEAPDEGNAPGARPKGAYFKLYESAYQAGYDPNVAILPERFTNDFPSEKEAVEFVCSLNPKLAQGNEERIAQNVSPFLSQIDGGVRFCIQTTAAIIWWHVDGRAAYSPSFD